MVEVKYLRLGITLAFLLGSASNAHEMHASHASASKPAAQAQLVDGAGRAAGQVTLAVNGDRLEGVVDTTGLTPGRHGIHIHTTGKCEGPAFASAGGHLNPEGKQHGLENPLGAHQGDLPDLIVGADGKGHASFTVHASLAALFDADGAAFVVHGGADDQKTDPSGNSGPRILCGVLEPAAK